MAHEKHPAIGELTYAGRYQEAIGKAYAAYLEDPEENLVTYVSTLYSARKKLPREVKIALAKLIHPLSRRVSVEFDRKNADALDVISTILGWCGYGVKLGDWVLARSAGFEAVNLGIDLVDGESATKHTLTLLLITKARFMFWTHNGKLAVSYLKEAADRALLIEDVNQRSRALRNCGILLGLHGHPVKGFLLFRMARQVPGIAPATRAKNRII